MNARILPPEFMMQNHLTCILAAPDLEQDYQTRGAMPRCGAVNSTTGKPCNQIIGKPGTFAEFLALHRGGRCKRHAATDDDVSAARAAAARAKATGVRTGPYHR